MASNFVSAGHLVAHTNGTPGAIIFTDVAYVAMLDMVLQLLPTWPDPHQIVTPLVPEPMEALLCKYGIYED
jgi:hypothetical protein